MPTFEIIAPDGTKYQVDGPDGATEEQALQQVQAQLNQPQGQSRGTLVPQASAQPQAENVSASQKGFFQTYIDRPGNPLLSAAQDFITEPVAQLASGTVGSIVGGWRGILSAAADKVSPTAQAMTYEPRTPAGKAGAAVVSNTLGLIPKAGNYLGSKTSEGLTALGASPEVSGAAGAGVNTAFQVGAPIAIGKVMKVAKDGIASARASAAPLEADQAPWFSNEKPAAGLGKVSEKTPTIEELSAQSSAAYKRASDAGIEISNKSLNGLKSNIVGTLKKEGIDPTLHPSTTAAVKRIIEKKGNISLDDLETLRKISSDAKKSNLPADQRLASIVVDEIDNYITNLSPKDVTKGDPAAAAALSEARSLYSRKMKAQEIEGLIERAKISAPNFSGSGMENALRTEFRALAKNKNRMRRFTAEEQAAIKKVAVGGPLENTLRMLGKFAPTGVVSTGLSAGAGFLVGGPTGATALPAAGAAARYAATKMTTKNALAASEIMRRGPQNSLSMQLPKNELVY